MADKPVSNIYSAMLLVALVSLIGGTVFVVLRSLALGYNPIGIG